MQILEIICVLVVEPLPYRTLQYYNFEIRLSSGEQVERVLSQPVHRTAAYRCDDTRRCIIQF